MNVSSDVLKNIENALKNGSATAVGVRKMERAEQVLSTPAGPDHTAPPLSRGHVMATRQSTFVAFVPQPTVPTRVPTDYLADVPAESVVVRATHIGEPLGKHRPRFNKKTGRVYTPNATKVHQDNLAAAATAAAGPFTADGEWAYGIRAVFYVQTYQRKDVDNLLKAVLDAMNRLVFKDDSQVKEVMGWSVLDTINPRTEFVVYRTDKLHREQGVCVVCGGTFRRYKSWKARLYCSRECNTKAVRQSVEVPCAHCGKTLLREPAQIEKNVGGEFFCSGSCIGLHKRRSVSCSMCGSHISRPLSFTKKGQVNFYCGMTCRAAAQVGVNRTDSPERRREISLRGWETRKAKKAPAE
jgi:Holliday junction resolvase RusA-like endonuclease